MKKTLKNTPLSVLDLVPSLEGKTHKTSINYTLELAQHIEKLGYNRIWISEHHNTESLLSSATPIIMSHILQGTNSIRVGSGGIMLPNHTPLIVAEQIGTLATLYPDRIDLGLGRAPGTDQVTARALRRDKIETVNDFPREVQELQFYLDERHPDARVRAIPGEGTKVPIYLLGSSTFSAQLAAALGLPYVFASHFAPQYLFEALEIYRDRFKVSKQIEKPYTMAGVNVVVADTDEEAEYLATSGYIFKLNIIRNVREALKPPVKNMMEIWSVTEEAHVKNMSKYSFIGSKETVRKGLEKFVDDTDIDELIVSSFVYDQDAKLRSYSLLSELMKE